MMNNKGFTLIELIAIVVILGVLMLITVPNMAGIIKNNKEIAATEDVNRMVNNAKARFNVKSAKYPANENSCVVLSMAFINTNDDLKKGINGGKYLQNESFIVVRKDSKDSGVYEYNFYVRIVEEFEGEKFEIPLVEAKKFQKDPKGNMPNLAPQVDIDINNIDAETLRAKLSEMQLDCGSIDRIYT